MSCYASLRAVEICREDRRLRLTVVTLGKAGRVDCGEALSKVPTRYGGTTMAGYIVLSFVVAF